MSYHSDRSAPATVVQPSSRPSVALPSPTMICHRMVAKAERADHEEWATIDARLRAAQPRPIAAPVRSGTIRSLIFGAVVMVIVALLAHVVLADPLGRLAVDIERAEREFCGPC